MLPVHIAGLGFYLPKRRVDNAELEARLGIPAEWIERATGVRERRYATHETSAGMGAAAAFESWPGGLSSLLPVRIGSTSEGTSPSARAAA